MASQTSILPPVKWTYNDPCLAGSCLCAHSIYNRGLQETQRLSVTRTRAADLCDSLVPPRAVAEVGLLLRRMNKNILRTREDKSSPEAKAKDTKVKELKGRGWGRASTRAETCLAQRTKIAVTSGPLPGIGTGFVIFFFLVLKIEPSSLPRSYMPSPFILFYYFILF